MQQEKVSEINMSDLYNVKFLFDFLYCIKTTNFNFISFILIRKYEI